MHSRCLPRSLRNRACSRLAGLERIWFAIVVGTTGAALAASSARAQDATKPPPPIEFAGDLGLATVSGNSSTSTLTSNEHLIRRLGYWSFRQDFASVYGKTNGLVSSNQLRTGLRADYALSKRSAIYLLGAYDRDRFAGIKGRFGEGAGLVAKVLANDADELDFEGGYQQTQQRNVDSTSKNFWSLRAATNYKHAFTKAAYFLQTAEFLPGLQNDAGSRLNTETAIAAPLSTHMSMKLDYAVHYNNRPPLNAAGTAPLLTTDAVFSAGIQVSY